MPADGVIARSFIFLFRQWLILRNFVADMNLSWILRICRKKKFCIRKYTRKINALGTVACVFEADGLANLWYDLGCCQTIYARDEAALSSQRAERLGLCDTAPFTLLKLTELTAKLVCRSWPHDHANHGLAA